MLLGLGWDALVEDVNLWDAFYALAIVWMLVTFIRTLYVIYNIFRNRLFYGSKRLYFPASVHDPPLSSEQNHFQPAQGARLLVILGSGGHTSELLKMLRDTYALVVPEHVEFVIGSDDQHSRIQLEHAEYCSFPHYHVSIIPRPRSVGQSYFSSFFSTLVSCAYSAQVVWSCKAQTLITNGPGIGVPFVLCMRAAHIFLWKSVNIIFIESFCRIFDFSLTGCIVFPFVDRFVVHWPHLMRKSKFVEFHGPLVPLASKSVNDEGEEKVVDRDGEAVAAHLKSE